MASLATGAWALLVRGTPCPRRGRLAWGSVTHTVPDGDGDPERLRLLHLFGLFCHEAALGTHGAPSRPPGREVSCPRPSVLPFAHRHPVSTPLPRAKARSHGRARVLWLGEVRSLPGWPCDMLPSVPGRPLYSALQPQATAGRLTPATPEPRQTQDPIAMVTREPSALRQRL